VRTHKTPFRVRSRCNPVADLQRGISEGVRDLGREARPVLTTARNIIPRQCLISGHRKRMRGGRMNGKMAWNITACSSKNAVTYEVQSIQRRPFEAVAAVTRDHESVESSK